MKNVNILNCYEKLKALKDTWSLWYRRVKKGHYSNLLSLEGIFAGTESSSLISVVCEQIMAHLEVLLTSFNRYFDVGTMETSEELIMNPHCFNLKSADGKLKEDLINVG